MIVEDEFFDSCRVLIFRGGFAVAGAVKRGE